MIKQAHKKKKHREKLDIALGRDTSAMPYSKKNKKIQKIPREHDYFMGFSEVRQKKKKKPCSEATNQRYFQHMSICFISHFLLPRDCFVNNIKSQKHSSEISIWNLLT